MARPDRRSPRPTARWPSATLSTWVVALLFFSCLASTARAAHVVFENCLRDGYRNAEPTPLQWLPIKVDARFDTHPENNTLLVTMWGNVTGSRFTNSPLPPPGSPLWDDPEEKNGKIFREPEGQSKMITTLLSKVDFLSYGTPNHLADFCNDTLMNAKCPLGPVFDANMYVVLAPANLCLVPPADHAVNQAHHSNSPLST